MDSLRRFYTLIFAGLLVASFTSLQGQETEPVGGPYEPDSATVLLLHFNGDLSNDGGMTADGVKHGAIAFIDQSPIDGGGQSAYMDNDSPSDSTYIHIPDTAALDLTGSWTMEAWVNLFTYGETNEDHRWRPKLLVKPGVDVRSHSNYYNVLRGDLRAFNTGYWTPSGGGWVEIRSPNDFFHPGIWYHVAFMRDSVKNVLIQVVHQKMEDGSIELIHYESYQYDPITESPPNTTASPAYIGINLGQAGGWLDGFLEEMRISNVVRNFQVPPLLTNAVELDNQPEAESFEVSVEASKIGPGSITEVKLHYSTEEGAWDSTAMTNTGDLTYVGNIPSQPFGSIVQYYYSATDNSGLRAELPNRASQDSNYYSFGIYRPESMTLSLDFEEGGGSPADASQYGHTVSMIGNPVYSEDAIQGEYSIALEGDSSFLEIESPFLAGEQFSLDFWFKADTLPPSGPRMVAREGNPWYQVNYQVRFFAGGRVAATSYIPTSGEYVGDEELSDSTMVIDPGHWYRAIYEGSGDSLVFQLRDSLNEVMSTKATAIDGPPVVTSAPLRIGHAGQANNPFFQGKIDALSIHNYPYLGIKMTGITGESGILPDRITLEQNYPNPFNPITTIEFSLPERREATLTVYDLLGRQITTLLSGEMAPGTHTVQWDGTDQAGHAVSSGIYFYRLETGQENYMQKMVLLR